MCDVLVLDDDPLILMTLAEYLREEGFEVEEAVSSSEARRQFKVGPRPRILVTDMNLGEPTTGLDFALEIRKERPDLPVIFITARPDFLVDHPMDERQRLLRKPFALTRLGELIKELRSQYSR